MHRGGCTSKSISFENSNRDPRWGMRCFAREANRKRSELFFLCFVSLSISCMLCILLSLSLRPLSTCPLVSSRHEKTEVRKAQPVSLGEYLYECYLLSATAGASLGHVYRVFRQHYWAAPSYLRWWRAGLRRVKGAVIVRLFTHTLRSRNGASSFKVWAR